MSEKHPRGRKQERPHANQVLSALKRVPLFASLSHSEMVEMAGLVGMVRYGKGEILFEAGDPGSSLFMLHQGEVALTLGEREERRIVARLAAGDFFGEMAVLTGEPRAVTVQALADAQFLVLERVAFEKLARRNPAILRCIGRTLSQRLRNTLDDTKLEPLPRIVACVGARGGSGVTVLAENLAASLARQSGGRVALLTAEETIPAAAPNEQQMKALARRTAHGVDLLALGSPDGRGVRPTTGNLSPLLERVKSAYPYAVVDCRSGGRGRAWVEAADLTIAVSNIKRDEGGIGAARKAQSKEVVEVLVPTEGRTIEVPYLGAGIFRLPNDKEGLARARADGRPLVVVEPSSRFAKRIDAIARNVMRREVGLALGGGAAWGIAHVGVIEVLEAHGIPIDLVAGTSIGSVIGALYASLGLEGAKEVAGTMRSIRHLIGLVDLSVFTSGIVRGDNIRKWLAHTLAHEQLTDLDLPFWAVATDIDSGEEVVFQRGRIVDAVRASVAIPGVFTPHVRDGRVLVDGGLVDNVPVRVCHQMGGDQNIAVNVVPHVPTQPHAQAVADGGTGAAHPDAGGPGALARRAAHWVEEGLAGSFRGLNLIERFGIAMKSMQIMIRDAGMQQARMATITLSPEVGRWTWADFHRVDELIEAGRVEAEKRIGEIKRAIDARTADAG